jgi:hypothetical protein
MKKAQKLTAVMAAVMMLAAASAFADSRHQRETDDRDWSWNRGRVVTVEGRIRDIDRERNGFVIRLHDERVPLFVERQQFRGRDLERGDVIRATGNVQRGVLYADRLTVVRDRDRNRNGDWGNAMISGTVEGVDARRGVLWLRDARSRQSIRVEVRNDSLYDVRRGDRVSVRGDWRRDGSFIADRVRQERW